MPEKTGRYLIFIRCKRGQHSAIHCNLLIACCGWNIAYFTDDMVWEFSHLNPVSLEYEIVDWQELPEKPNMKMEL